MKVKAWFKKFFAGMAIGTGAAIPGVSGAAIAVIFRVYEDIIGAVNNFRKKFGWALSILIPILLGVLLAVGICIILFHIAFCHFMFVLMCLFAGFLVGSFPGITDEVKGEKLNRKAIILMVIGFVFVIILGVLSVIAGINGFNVGNLFVELPWWLYLVLIPVGAVAAVALTVPGLSGSLILLIIGFYRPLIDSVEGWAKAILKGNTDYILPLLGVIGCFAIGCLIGVVLVSKVMNVLLRKWRKETFYAIIGFIAGSVFVLFFNYEIFKYYQVWGGQVVAGIDQYMPMWLEMIVGFVVLGACAFGSYQLVRVQRKKDAIESAE